MPHPVSDYICLFVAGFNAMCIQAHLTNRFTPAFSKDLEEKLPLHKQTLFWWAGVSDTKLRLFFCSVNALLTYLMFFPSLRTQGIKTTAGFLALDVYCDMRIGEKPFPQMVLYGLLGLAWYLR
ncbi:hypothetical protein V8C35DRAFT_315972 [Trichoderma chlorosporum]